MCVCAQLDRHSADEKKVLEKEFFFLLLSLTLSFPCLCFVLLDISSSLPIAHFSLSLHHLCFSFFL